jgi:hypothetical protein
MAVNIAMFTDNAVPIEHKNNTAIAPLYAVLRPKVLAIGAQIKLDDPIANKTPALVILMCSGVVPNSAAISGVAGYRHVLENVAARHMKLTVKRMTDLCQVGRSIPFLRVFSLVGGVVVEGSMIALNCEDGWLKGLDHWVEAKEKSRRTFRWQEKCTYDRKRWVDVYSRVIDLIYIKRQEFLCFLRWNDKDPESSDFALLGVPTRQPVAVPSSACSHIFDA